MGDSCETSSGDSITNLVCHVCESISGTSQEHPAASEAAQQPAFEAAQPNTKNGKEIFYALEENTYLTNEKFSQ